MKRTPGWFLADLRLDWLDRMIVFSQYGRCFPEPVRQLLAIEAERASLLLEMSDDAMIKLMGPRR